MVKGTSVDIKSIDLALEELGKLIITLDKDSDNTKRNKSLISKIEKIRDTLQDAVVYAKLKKSVTSRG